MIGGLCAFRCVLYVYGGAVWKAERRGGYCLPEESQSCGKLSDTIAASIGTILLQRASAAIHMKIYMRKIFTWVTVMKQQPGIRYSILSVFGLSIREFAVTTEGFREEGEDILLQSV